MQVDKTDIWSPNSWRNHPVIQLPNYNNENNLEACFEELKSYPPLVTSWEIAALKDKLARASRGEAFLLQGGDCAESFDNVTSPQVVNILKVLLQMSLILIHETNLPVIRVGRLAGQYAKPRSKDSEVIDGEEIPIYRGDLINSFEPDKKARQADPRRLLEGYQKASMTINFIRALSEGGGFADLHYPGYWELSFMKDNKYYDEYMAMVRSINKAITFVETISPNELTTLQRVHIYTSHEALNLYYDSAQTRQVPHRRGWYNLSAHMVWLGNRTRNLDGAHVEYLRGLENPIGIKVGPPYDIDELLKLIEVLNPNRESGKITLITRFGKDIVGEELPKVVNAVEKAGHEVLWSCDPMHGNTFSTDDELKTRDFDDILSEIRQTFAVHRAEGTNLGGVHLELTGENVTECVGGANGLSEDGLKKNYLTYCDPRLNYEQSLEMAFLIAKEKKKNLGLS